MKYYKYIVIIGCLMTSGVFAQNEEEGGGLNVVVDNSYVSVGEITPKHTFNVALGLPNGTINKPFESIMKGILDANTYYQYYLPNSLVFGAGLRYNLFAINEFRVPEPLDGVMHSFGGFVKIGYEKFFTTRFGMDFSIKTGYNWHYLKTDLNDSLRGGAYRFDSGFIEPTVGFILSATEKSAYRLTVGYTFQGYVFSPYKLGTLLSGGWDPNEYNKGTQFITIGLGYTYYFSKK